MRVLITGGAGFAGSHLIEHLLSDSDAEIFSLERVHSYPSDRVRHLRHDFNAPIPDRILEELGQIEYIIHSGAEVQGRGSVENPEFYVWANVAGTFHLLEAARKLKPKKFIYVSSAEAVGAAPEGVSWNESATLRPSNPYSASKAASEMLCQAYAHSFHVPAVIVRTMNIFGSRQHTDKFVPMVIKKLLEKQTIELHAVGGKFGSRHYLPVSEFVKALIYLLENGMVGETYHVVGPEIDNRELVATLARALQCAPQIKEIAPGQSHDMRYSIVDTKLSRVAYRNDTTIQSLNQTAAWYEEHPEWRR